MMVTSFTFCSALVLHFYLSDTWLCVEVVDSRQIPDFLLFVKNIHISEQRDYG